MRGRSCLSDRSAPVLAYLSVLAIAALGLACDGTNPVMPPVPAPKPEPVVLEWRHPLPQGNDLYRLWGFADGTFDAVGEAGTVLHFDGAELTPFDVPTRNDLHGIWASEPSDVYVCGFSGTLLHFDGAHWEAINIPTHEDLYAVWASSSDDVFVAGTGGKIWESSSQGWAETTVAPGQRFRALWGYSHDEVYAAGSRDVLYRFNGNDWSRVLIFDSPEYETEILDIWGPTPGTISLLDREGIQWFDGSSWNARLVSDTNAFGLWGFALDQQVAVSAGSSTHWIGSTPTRYDTPTREPLYDIWGLSPNDMYAVGRNGVLAHFDGDAWEARNAGGFDNLNDVWTTSTGAIAVGTDGSVLVSSGSTWSEQTIGQGYQLNGVWDSGTGTSVAVGRYAPDLINWRQAIVMNPGSAWSDAGPVGLAPQLFDVWGASSASIYAVGWAGEILRYNGTDWIVSDPGSGDASFLLSISGSSAANVIAVGRTNDRHGLVCRLDGDIWVKTTISNTEELRGVWVSNDNIAFAVGSGGSIEQFAEGKWSAMTSPTADELFCVFGSAANDVYAAGWLGALIHYDGSAWQELLPDTHRTIRAISGQASGGFLLVGDRGSIWHFAGLMNSLVLNR